MLRIFFGSWPAASLQMKQNTQKSVVVRPLQNANRFITPVPLVLAIGPNLRAFSLSRRKPHDTFTSKWCCPPAESSKSLPGKGPFLDGNQIKTNSLTCFCLSMKNMGRNAPFVSCDLLRAAPEQGMDCGDCPPWGKTFPQGLKGIAIGFF